MRTIPLAPASYQPRRRPRRDRITYANLADAYRAVTAFIMLGLVILLLVAISHGFHLPGLFLLLPLL